MFKYSNGRLSSKGISFAIPENFSINPEPASTNEDLIEFVSPDGTYYITINIEPSFEGTEYELEQYITEDAGSVPLKDIEAVTINGLSGHQLPFTGGNREEFQLRLSLHSTDEFVLHISTRKHNKIKPIVESDEIIKLINSIHAEK